MKINISIYKESDYRKSGKLKNSAFPERSFTFMDIPPITEGGTALFIKDVAKQSREAALQNRTGRYLY